MKYYRIINKKNNLPIITSASYHIIIKKYIKYYNTGSYKIIIVRKGN